MRVLSGDLKFGFFSGLSLLFFLIGLLLYHEWHLRHPPPEWVSSDLPEERLYPNSFLLKIGQFAVSPQSKKLLFLNFPKKKKKGVIRIGTFGDSYTYGDEVSDGNDYPSYLNRLFVKNAPNRKIEILNFGKGALGFQQTFMMWEKYATEYDLDYILLGPTGFEFFDRDVSFATNLRQRIKTDGPPKARYILTPDGKKLREIHLKGHTLWERYKRFYRLIPSWNQIRYDRCPFQALDDYFPFLWCPPSPLYYTNLTEPEEAIKINAILLKKMILKFPGKVLLLVRSNTTEDSDKEYALYQNINFIDINTIQMPQLFLYVRRSHRSNLGYEIWAESFFYALTGRSRFSIQTLSCNKKDNSITKIKPLDLKFPLNGVKHISLFSNDFNMGELIINSPGYNWQKELAFKIPKDTKSFIVFHSQDFTHSPVVVPISFPLTKGDKVFIGPPESDNRMFLGEINPLDERHIFFEFPLHHLERQKFIGFIHDDMEPAVAINIKSPHTRHPFIYVNDQAFGKLVPAGFQEGKLMLKPLITDHTLLLIGPDQNYSHGDLPNRLTFSFRFQMKDGREFDSAIPSWKCRKQHTNFKLHLPRFKPIKL